MTVAYALSAVPWFVIDAGIVVLLVALGAAGGVGFAWWRGRRKATAGPQRRVLLALAGPDLSCAAIDAVARIGRAENAVIVPAKLIPTPYRLPLDCPLPESTSAALDLLEVVENRLRRAGVEVDCRLVPGRTLRHAVRRLVAQERFDRLVVPAGDGGDGGGFGADDVGWLLAHVSGEVLVLRPAAAGNLADDVVRGRRPARAAGGPRTDAVVADPHRG